MAKYRIYYMRPEWFRNGICNQKPVIAELEKTHVFLCETEARDLDHVFYNMQGEIWSPNGEARELIQSKGLRHTSMSVGDVIELDGSYWLVSSSGFEDLTYAP